MPQLTTLIIELEVQTKGIAEDDILDTMYKALETKYGKGFVSTIDTIETEEE
ncbi:MAG: hypothetical protein WC004_00325 [Candidatus Absconditabacterales bacterium]